MKLKFIYARAYQKVTKFALSFIKFPTQDLLKGENSLIMLPNKLKDTACSNVFIMASKHVASSAEFNLFIQKIKENNISYKLIEDIVPNPTIKSVEALSTAFKAGNFDSILAIGGGSVIDSAKLVAALSASNKNTLKGMHGYMKIKGKLPLLIAVPTTAGSGSETTICAVVTDSQTYEKYSINDPKLMPKIIVLDPTLFTTLPKSLTAQTGMDALTHAIEAFIGFGGSKSTDENSLEAIRLIFNNLVKAYNNGHDLLARENMALASYKAGKAFTRAYVGYVHAIAHSLGGRYNLPHGLANAVILPHVLEAYGDRVYDKLSQLAVYLKLGNENETEEVLSYKFIAAIKNMNKNMGIPSFFEVIDPKDIENLCSHINKEVIPYYPVPKFFSDKELEAILLSIAK